MIAPVEAGGLDRSRNETEAELRRRVDQLSALYRLTATVSRAARLSDLYDEALRCLRSTLGADRSSILLFDEDGVMRFRAWSGLSDAYRRVVDGHSPWTRDDAGATPILVEDVSKDDAVAPYRRALDAEGIRALAFFPLTYGHEVLGKFMVYYGAPHRFTAAEVEVAQNVAQHLAVAVERMRVDAELRRAAVVLDNIADGVAVQDTRGSLLYANDAAARLAGLSSGAEMLAMDAAGVLKRFELLEPSGIPMPPERLPGRIALAEQRAAEATVRFRERGTGKERWVVVRAAPVLGEEGELLFAVNVVRDVTAEHHAREVQRFLSETGEILSQSLDLAQTMHAIARAVVPRLADHCVVYDLREDGSLEGIAEACDDPAKEQLLRELRRFPVATGAGSPIRRAIETRAPALAEDLTPESFATAAPSPEWLDLVRRLGVRHALTVPLTARGTPVGIMSCGMSHSGRRIEPDRVRLIQAVADRAAVAALNARLYEAELAARQTAEAAVRAREQLLAVVSHDLRTPLSAMSVATSLLDAVPGHGHPNKGGATETIRSAIENMNRLIEDLLDLARLNAGTLRIQKAPCSAGELLDQALQLVQPLAYDKGQRLELHSSCDDVIVSCDRARFVQVMSNLVGNAVKFTPHGGSVTLRATAGDGIFEIRVSDTGPGIAPEHLDTVFERYWQSSGGERAGVGLGLSIAKGIVEAHGGTLHAESGGSEGTTFVFTLPLA